MLTRALAKMAPPRESAPTPYRVPEQVRPCACRPRILSASIVGAVGLCASTSLAATPWIERPLTLPPLRFTADAGLGIGQTTVIDPRPLYDTPVGTQKPGAGLNFEAALGLPLGMQVGMRMGVRFGASGPLTNADAYGTGFDPLTLHLDTGTYSFANPELRLQKSLVDFDAISAALDLRLALGLADETANIFMPGIPVRIRIPGVARIDSGVFTPILFAGPNTWGVEIPVAVWFQRDKFFFGPLSGFYWNNPAYGTEAQAGVPSEVDIHAGLGLGYTLGSLFDVKAQLLTTRINDASWAKYIGGGVGLGLVLE